MYMPVVTTTISRLTSLFESTSGELVVRMIVLKMKTWPSQFTLLLVTFMYMLILRFWWQAGEQDGQEGEEEVGALLHWGGQGG